MNTVPNFPLPGFPLPGVDPLLSGAPRAHAPQPVRFSGDSRRFLALLARGALLELVTFGFYRFWLATAMRRHLWAATSAGGDAVEYTGRARELLTGFLVALAIVGPLAVINFLLGIYAENVRAFASLPLALFYYAFTQFALYRARRYRLTRTVWRGLRFWMTGSGWRYAWISFWWALLAVATLGLAWPWRAAALERYKMGNTFYGDLQGSFAGTGSALFARVWWLWLLVGAPLLLTGAVIAAAAAADIGAMGKEAEALAAATLGAAVLALAICVFFALPLLRASEWQWWAAGIRFGGVSFASAVRRRSVVWLYFKTMLASVAVVCAMVTALAIGAAIAAYVFGLRGDGLFKFDKASGLQPGSFGALLTIVASYLAVALAAIVVQRYFLQHEMWRLIAGSMTVTGLSAAYDVAARGVAANAIGEGLADGLDVAGF